MECQTTDLQGYCMAFVLSPKYLFIYSLYLQDIARLLQEMEIQEEKKRKKHFPESSGVSAYGDSYYYEDGGNNSCL